MITKLDAILSNVHPPLLVVEDHEDQRAQLIDNLRRGGIEARQAANSREALHEANSAPVGVVLMDHVLNDEMDGINLAREIQRLYPASAVIFVTGQDASKIDWSRIHQSQIHVEGVIEKPIIYHRQELLRLIEKAHIKVRIREILSNAERRHLDPFTYLHALADFEERLSPEIIPEILAELTSSTKEAISPGSSGEVTGIDVVSEINNVYDQIHELARTRAGDPDLPRLLKPLREQLEELEEMEAVAMERRYREQLEFDPSEANKLLVRVERLLGNL